ncbi:cysteine protease ATG4B [Parasteatoda tepidariorum]|uniref:cysteine protease ATG4B n=1 Tax=Parasteatoda tepidariorum TaxID=114398 RepID=UPI001C72217D|nr:cysteine protease ATG4B [Parasteatoda tepidariorum]XP_042898260.1 cysteine protease ATG4B [Parasteatoda tepidariorum]
MRKAEIIYILHMDLYNFFSSANGQTSIHSKKDSADFPFSLDDVWILGKKYNSLHDLEDLRSTIRSKLWFSYRSGFPAIGGTGPKTDKYWGCMLRCGQMVMAEALICRHLGRGWQWTPGVIDPVYKEILKMFQDKKDCPYSIHQIAQMGVSEKKTIGEWFGPNTIAQVLRKLSMYDEWSSIAVHVAFDNSVIQSDIRTLCRYHPEPLASSPFTMPRQTVWYTDCESHRCQRWQAMSSVLNREPSSSWRPMLLFIPLRLGVSNFNPVYTKSIKNSFKIKQSLGILGGKPRHATWFIGYTSDELICLDPHVTQPTVNFDGHKFDDSSYHVPIGGSKRMSINDMDPSISLCFYFHSEDDFDDWCEQVQQLLVIPGEQHLFEIIPERPKHWPPLDLRPDLNCSNCSLDYFFVEDEDASNISDEEFESIGSLMCLTNLEN